MPGARLRSYALSPLPALPNPQSLVCGDGDGYREDHGGWVSRGRHGGLGCVRRGGHGGACGRGCLGGVASVQVAVMSAGILEGYKGVQDPSESCRCHRVHASRRMVGGVPGGSSRAGARLGPFALLT